MTLAADLLAQAKHLATKETRRPRQASLRRAVSATYYALFHMLVQDAVRRLMGGKDRLAIRNCLSRAFDHGTMKQVSQQFADGNLSPKLSPGLNGEPLQDELRRVARAFVSLQQYRHEADYNMERSFTRLEVLRVVSRAHAAFSDWRSVRGSIQADTFLVGLLAFDKMRL